VSEFIETYEHIPKPTWARLTSRLADLEAENAHLRDTVHEYQDACRLKGHREYYLRHKEVGSGF
jgi:hypothetical protein